MSKVKISGNASGTGTLTITAPNTDTDRSLTLPDKAGELVCGAGSVLQVVRNTYSTEVESYSSSYVDTGLTASITPTSTSSKILILINQPLQAIATQNSYFELDAKILRGSTTILEQPGFEGGRAGTSDSSDVVMNGSYDAIYLDSPSTTSSITYKTQMNITATRFKTSNNSSEASMTLMEIAG